MNLTVPRHPGGSFLRRSFFHSASALRGTSPWPVVAMINTTSEYCRSVLYSLTLLFVPGGHNDLEWETTHQLDTIHIGDPGFEPQPLRNSVQVLCYLLAVPRLRPVKHQDGPARERIRGRGPDNPRAVGARHGVWGFEAGCSKAERTATARDRPGRFCCRRSIRSELVWRLG